MEKSEILSRFVPAELDEEQESGVLELRNLFLRTALDINMILPDSREKSLCLTYLEQARMWAIEGMSKSK